MGPRAIIGLISILSGVQCGRFKPNDTPPQDQIRSEPGFEVDGAEPASALDSGGLAGDCRDTCAEEGAFQCSGKNLVQLCTKTPSCWAWHTIGGCSAEHLCCGGVCEVADESNCYACGNQCNNETPVCSKALGRCVCDELACAKKGKVCDATASACAAPAPGVDYYVAASDDADAGEADGTALHPFRTITLALSRARSAGPPVRIHVGPGTFDAQHGETFPLVVRGNTSLLASDDDNTKTVIAGSGYYDPRQLGPSAFDSIVNGTIVMGDSSQQTSVAGFTLRPGDNAVGATQGVFCDRGNALEMGVSVEEPNTILSHLNIAPGYDTAIIATATTLPASTGCNLRMTRNTIQVKRVGVSALGCDENRDSPQTAVALDLGDGSATGGNVFSGQGIGVTVGECVTRLGVRHDVFSMLDGGILVKQLLRVGPFKHAVFRDNTFTRLTQFGVRLAGGAVVVDTFNDNLFSGISSVEPSPTNAGTGLLMEGMDQPEFPQIRVARRNTFFDNDIGVRFYAPSRYDWTLPASDFGTIGDPGGNSFQCNSQPSGSNRSIPGGDLVVDLDVFDPVALAFVGNSWDRIDPIQRLMSIQANGADIMLRSVSPVVVDATGSKDGAAACPPERVR